MIRTVQEQVPLRHSPTPARKISGHPVILPTEQHVTRKHYTVQAGTYRLHLGRKTCLMGILNATPDSFSLDGCYSQKGGWQRALARIRKMVKDGADIIDIGGESTRPGSAAITANEEKQRVLPLVESAVKKINIPVSVDTYKSSVARAALDAGASMINTIMGVDPDVNLLKMVKRYNAAIVLMHIRGTPRTMQKNIHYNDVTGDITEALRKSIEKCLEIGINSARIIVDPGIGFGKTVEHNLEIINRLDQLRVLDQPLLIGPSRKSFIGNILDQDVQQRLTGTCAAISAGILRGAHIVRVHDVCRIKETATITDAIMNEHYKKIT